MRILERYILKYFLPSLLWCLAIFSFLYIIIDLFGHIDEVIRGRVPIGTLLYYYLSFIPLIFVQTSPIAILLATVYNLSNLNKNNEIVAMKASGINIWNILTPMLLTALLVSIVSFLVSDKVVPKSTRISTRIKEEYIDQKQTQHHKSVENLAIYGKRNRIIYARLFDGQKNELHDVVIHGHDIYQNLTLKIDATKARFIDDRWVFYNVLISKLNNHGQLIGDPTFYDEKTIDMDETPSELLKKEWRPEFMNYKELENYLNLFKGGSEKTLNGFRVDLYHKISFPLISVIIILVGAPSALHLRRGGALAGIGISIVISLAYYAFSAISLAFGKASILPPIVAAWLGNIVFGIIGFIQIQRLR